MGADANEQWGSKTGENYRLLFSLHVLRTCLLVLSSCTPFVALSKGHKLCCQMMQHVHIAK